MTRSSRGFSIVELLIGVGLFGLISTSIGILVRTGLEYLRMAEIRAELSRQSLFALSGISRELVESNSDAIRLAQPGLDPPGVVFASPRSASGGINYVNNHLQWNRWICVYWDQPSLRLVRLIEDFDSPTTFTPDPSPIGANRSTTTMSTSSGVGRRLLARNVTNFDVQGVELVNITLEVQAGVGTRVSKLTTQTTLSPRH